MLNLVMKTSVKDCLLQRKRVFFFFNGEFGFTRENHLLRSKPTKVEALTAVLGDVFETFWIRTEDPRSSQQLKKLINKTKPKKTPPTRHQPTTDQFVRAASSP